MSSSWSGLGRVRPGSRAARDRSGPAQPPVDGPEIVLDLSRLLSRILKLTPTGVDRVEMAYALGLMRAVPHRLSFAAVQPSGLYGRLDPRAVHEFLAIVQRRWLQNSRPSRSSLLRQAGTMLWALRPRPIPAPLPGRRRVHLHASPDHLDRRTLMQSILRREQAVLVCLVHDLIPIEYPEYARPDGAARHRARIETIVGLSDGIVANSEATRGSLRRHLDRAGRSVPVRVAHLGTEAHPEALYIADPVPYFVCIATIEPRKNHLLLLNIWRRIVEERGAAATPRLILIGRRGWENEQIIDMLERCPALEDRVIEHAGLPDQAVARLLAGARALLLPSFAEGFGLPVTEALAAGVPVICSDLPALREAGDRVADYLDPLDGPGWMDAILDYATPRSSRRSAQLERLAGWTAPSWEAHLAAVIALVDQAAR